MVPSAAPALFLLAGQVVGLYSRFDVIVSTLHVCMPRLKFGPLHALVGCLYLSVPMPTHPTCIVMHVPVHICSVHLLGSVSLLWWHNGLQGHLGALNGDTSITAPGSPEDLQQPGHQCKGGAAAAQCLPGGGPHLLPPRTHGGHN